MIKACSVVSKESNSLKNQYESMKDKYLQEKYLIGTACFQLATQICVRERSGGSSVGNVRV